MTTDAAYVWRLEGEDPYAIKIKNDSKYINSVAGLSDDAQTFMLLPKDDYDYGVLATTGNKGRMLTMGTATDAPLGLTTTDPQTDPAHFIIFALGAKNVIYHLVIANFPTYNESGVLTGGYEEIPWRDPEARGTLYDWNDGDKGYDKEYKDSGVIIYQCLMSFSVLMWYMTSTLTILAMRR